MKRFVHLCLIPLLLLSAAMIGGCAAHAESDVYAIKKTASFHREDCFPVHMAKTIKMTVAEAKREQLRPCPLCKPEQE